MIKTRAILRYFLPLHAYIEKYLLGLKPDTLLHAILSLHVLGCLRVWRKTGGIYGLLQTGSDWLRLELIKSKAAKRLLR